MQTVLVWITFSTTKDLVTLWIFYVNMKYSSAKLYHQTICCGRQLMICVYHSWSICTLESIYCSLKSFFTLDNKAVWYTSTSAPETTTTRSLLYVPSKESIQMVAIGDEWVAMDTNKQLLWLLTVGGVQCEVVSLELQWPSQGGKPLSTRWQLVSLVQTSFLYMSIRHWECVWSDGVGIGWQTKETV